jgi:Inner membrane component of T3SS, cytoplasmic domain
VGRIVIVEILDAHDAVRQRVRLDRWPAIIGRAYSADVLLDDPYVSPEHVRVIDGDGSGVVVEDLASVNGLYAADGARVSRATLLPGSVIRVGRTHVRFCSATDIVAPALVDDAPAVGRAESATGGDTAGAATGARRGWRRLSATAGLVVICIAAAVVFTVQSYVDGYQRNGATAAIEAGAGLFLILVLWAAPWALASRVVMQRAQLLTHLAVASAAIIAAEIVADAGVWCSYLFPGSSLAGLIVDAGFCGIFAGLLGGHLALVSAMPARRRWRIVGTVTAALLALGLLVSHADAVKFTTRMDYAASLRPFPIAWLPTTSVREFIAATGDLKARVDSLASER